MDHIDIAGLEPGQSFDEFFICRDASLKTTRNGSLYVETELMDKSGRIKGRQWDAAREDLANYPAGHVIKVRAIAERYQGVMQLKIQRTRSAHESECDPKALMPVSAEDPDALEAEMDRWRTSVKDAHLLALLAAIFEDPLFRPRFLVSPAAEVLHHPFLHGLLEHTVTLLRAADAVTAVNPRVDRDLLVTGVLLHDIGKTDELSSEGRFGYTVPGTLIGHVVLGTLRVAEAIEKIPDFPEELRLRVLHMILSHHGRREFGAPVVPMTPEAFCLHQLDNLDAKLEAADRLIDGHPVTGDHWTEWTRMFEARLFRGLREPE